MLGPPASPEHRGIPGDDPLASCGGHPAGILGGCPGGGLEFFSVRCPIRVGGLLQPEIFRTKMLGFSIAFQGGSFDGICFFKMAAQYTFTTGNLSKDIPIWGSPRGVPRGIAPVYPPWGVPLPEYPPRESPSGPPRGILPREIPPGTPPGNPLGDLLGGSPRGSPRGSLQGTSLGDPPGGSLGESVWDPLGGPGCAGLG